jgi:epoxyqueuosine reductase
LFLWTEDEFDTKTQGSPIRRIGYERWLRNLAVGIGNGENSPQAISALRGRLEHSPLVDEHIQWALTRLDNSA